MIVAFLNVTAIGPVSKQLRLFIRDILLHLAFVSERTAGGSSVHPPISDNKKMRLEPLMTTHLFVQLMYTVTGIGQLQSIYSTMHSQNSPHYELYGNIQKLQLCNYYFAFKSL